jgi:hypothetical protein
MRVRNSQAGGESLGEKSFEFSRYTLSVPQFSAGPLREAPLASAGCAVIVCPNSLS